MLFRGSFVKSRPFHDDTAKEVRHAAKEIVPKPQK